MQLGRKPYDPAGHALDSKAESTLNVIGPTFTYPVDWRAVQVKLEFTGKLTRIVISNA